MFRRFILLTAVLSACLPEVLGAPAVSPHRTGSLWKAYDGGAAPVVSGYMDVPFMAVSDEASPDAFRIAGDGKTAAIYYSEEDAAVVRVAARALRDDIERVTGLVPTVSTKRTGAPVAIFIGTIGSSRLIDGLVSTGKIDVSDIQGKWEAYTATVVVNPFEGLSKALIIAGSDRRGTAFGVFGLSESMGVSPWYWWGDAAVPKKKTLYVSGSHTQPSPGVKYRGIFLNDEDWGLQPWAAKTFEPEVGNIGPKTYATIFELLLRLHANCIWPAMHEFPVHTTPFYLVPGNAETADEYAIVISTSHHEPMMTNSHEYDEKKHGLYDYWKNRGRIYKFWEDRVRETAGYENIYTMGMRGRADAGMRAPKGSTDRDKAKKIENDILPDQRKMIADHVDKDVAKVPQIFIPYKETLVQYQAGLQLPDDITIIWPDDNHGYIRQLSTEAERKRSGGSGVYYHLSYWGSPSCYLWFCSTPPGMTQIEMLKAWDFEARNVWLVNVGDLKPMEVGMDFFLRMARNPEAFREFDQTDYFVQWARQTFGATHAGEIADLLNEYFRLNIVKRPEHMRRSAVQFSLVNQGDEARTRLDHFAAMTAAAEAVYKKLPGEQKTGFYEMVLYPIRASNYVNRRDLLAKRSRLWADQKRAATAELAAEARAANDALFEEVRFYNEENAGGKWNHMLSPAPHTRGWVRDTQNAFLMPDVGSYSPSAESALGVSIEGDAALLEEQTPGLLPVFNRATDSSRFIDIFNQGKHPAKWTARASAPWIKLSEATGKNDARIQVSIDWSTAPKGSLVAGEITVRGSGFERVVHLQVANPVGLESATLPAVVEDGGTVVIEAENYTDRKDSDTGVGWRRFGHATASGDGITLQPFRADSLDSDNLPPDAPSVDYEFLTFSSGPVSIRTQCLPTHRITSDHAGLRYAISLNGDTPQVVDIYAKEYSHAWKANTMRAASIGVTRHNIAKPGLQQVRIWMVDAGVVLDKLTVNISSGTYEAEGLSVQDSNAEVVTFSDPPASGGGGLHIKARKKGDFATLVIPEVKAGTYKLSVCTKKWNSCGIVQMAVAESPNGTFKDIGDDTTCMPPMASIQNLKRFRLNSIPPDRNISDSGWKEKIRRPIIIGCCWTIFLSNRSYNE